jgi:hypothetical protein
MQTHLEAFHSCADCVNHASYFVARDAGVAGGHPQEAHNVAMTHPSCLYLHAEQRTLAVWGRGERNWQREKRFDRKMVSVLKLVSKML